MSLERELKIMNENLKTIAVNQAMIYNLMLQIVNALPDASIAQAKQDMKIPHKPI